MHLSARFKWITLLFFTLVLFLMPLQANAEEMPENYYVKKYGTLDGLKSAEINAIIQTDDHYIWVGSYSGLYKYNGLSFSNVLQDQGVLNVMSLYSASDGHLWIGTNDCGIIRYDPVTRETISYTVDDGLGSNSVRSICEGKNGTIYLGGLNSLNLIDQKGNIQSIKSMSIPGYVQSLCCLDNGVVVGVTNSGVAGYVKDGSIILLDSLFDADTFFYAVEKIHANHVLLVTSADQIYEIDFSSSTPIVTQTYGMGELSEVNSIKSLAGKCYICCNNGLGYLDNSGNVHEVNVPDFSLSICDVLEDYQGNLWIASSKLGVAKLAKSPFSNPLQNTPDSNHVVNTIAEIDGHLVLGCDDGIVALSDDTYKTIDLPWASQFDGIRIRNLYQDSSKNIWVSTYSQLGLVRIAPDETVTFYNDSNNAIMGSRFRFVKEGRDGTLYAASNAGLTILKNATPVKTLGTYDGLKIPQILDLVETADGSILAATDGSGIYVIKNQEIVDHIGRENGLKSQIILKIIPCTDGHIYIASNALYYDNGTTIKLLAHFPYSNCFDMYISKAGQVWVCSSAGIYVLDEQDMLLDDENYNYILLNDYRGLDTPLTANAWHYADAQDTLYLCTTTGIRTISIPKYNSESQSRKVTAYIESVVVDGNPLEPDENGVYQIPAGTNRVTIFPAVLNYDLSIPTVHIWLDGFDDAGVEYKQLEQSSVSFTNLISGSYTLKLQILHERNRTILNEISAVVVQHEFFYKSTLFSVLFAFLLLCFVSYLTWLIVRSAHFKEMQQQYLRIQDAKAEAERANQSKGFFLAKMSHEIRTPINSIVGMNELIMEESDSETIRSYARDIETSSNTLLSLINEVLDVTKLDSDKLTLTVKPYHLLHLLRELYLVLKTRGHAKGLEIVCDFDENLPSMLIGDELHLKEVILNLISNAVKYTQEGTVALHIKLVEDSQENVKLGISVTDTGIGISPEDQQRIFDVFERLDSQHTPYIKGTGLGLYISKRILALMDTQLEVSSEVGKGSDFHFVVEQKRASTETIGASLHQVVSTVATSKKTPLQYINPHVRILVVDDTALNLKVASHMLEKTQAQIDTAQSAEECLRLVVENRYDLILLDDMMPGISGSEALLWIRSHPNKCSNVPIVALTANALQGTREKYLALGFDEYLSKPVMMSELERILHTFLPEDQYD